MRHTGARREPGVGWDQASLLLPPAQPRPLAPRASVPTCVRPQDLSPGDPPSSEAPGSLPTRPSPVLPSLQVDRGLCAVLHSAPRGGLQPGGPLPGHPGAISQGGPQPLGRQRRGGSPLPHGVRRGDQGKGPSCSRGRTAAEPWETGGRASGQPDSYSLMALSKSGHPSGLSFPICTRGLHWLFPPPYAHLGRRQNQMDMLPTEPSMASGSPASRRHQWQQAPAAKLGSAAIPGLDGL